MLADRGLMACAGVCVPQVWRAQCAPGATRQQHLRRAFSVTRTNPSDQSYLKTMRNIGISAHIDSGKTTLTERILYYTGRIHEIHEVRGKDGVGAKMDSMDLEREKGITIQSAATFCKWKDTEINIIDTPGHVDFTIEVERALRVLDAAVLVVCAVGGVQSQTNTVDRQMKRYKVPRIAFINKMDRMGSDPWRIVGQLREKLQLNAGAIQIPIGIEDKLEGLVDLISMKSATFHGEKGEEVRWGEIPADLADEAKEKRAEMIELLANVDDAIGEKFLLEEEITEAEMIAGMRRATIANTFVPVMMGSAYKNRGVQLLLDRVQDILPDPTEVSNTALDLSNNEAEVVVKCDSDEPLVALAFKLQDSPFGQLTYLRLYSGTMKKGENVVHVNSGKKIKVPRLVRMHSNEMEDVAEVKAGDIVCLFGVDCATGDSFTDGKVKYSMTSMHVPEAVMSLALSPKAKGNLDKFSKALNRFMREDPTFRVGFDSETKQTIISGMGELHLQIYVERIKREYGVDCEVGEPRVNYRESITRKAQFDYQHKKQSGGQGQYGRVIGYVEPLDDVNAEPVFENMMIGNVITPSWMAAIEKGFREQALEGTLTDHPVSGCRFVIEDGASHAVDSSELAFKIAAKGAFKEACNAAGAVVLEPVMTVQVTAPEEFQGVCVSLINKRKGVISGSETQHGYVVVDCVTPLANMFGFSTELRSSTQGKGEYTMEYKEHMPVAPNVQADLIAHFQKEKEEKQKASA